MEDRNHQPQYAGGYRIFRQIADESLEDIANKTYNFGKDGYPDASEDIREIIAVEAFLKGCVDKLAVAFAMNQNPTSIYS